MNTLPLNEEALLIMQSSYADWIEHPTTQQLLTLLQKRKQHYVKTLTDQILQKSDKEFEDKQRAAISTIEAILRIVSDRDQFIQHSTKRTEPNDK
jgi:hypothetical protein